MGRRLHPHTRRSKVRRLAHDLALVHRQLAIAGRAVGQEGDRLRLQGEEALDGWDELGLQIWQTARRCALSCSARGGGGGERRAWRMASKPARRTKAVGNALAHFLHSASTMSASVAPYMGSFHMAQ